MVCERKKTRGGGARARVARSHQWLAPISSSLVNPKEQTLQEVDLAGGQAPPLQMTVAVIDPIREVFSFGAATPWTFLNTRREKSYHNPLKLHLHPPLNALMGFFFKACNRYEEVGNLYFPRFRDDTANTIGKRSLLFIYDDSLPNLSCKKKKKKV